MKYLSRSFKLKNTRMFSLGLLFCLALVSCRKTQQILGSEKSFHSKKYGDIIGPSVEEGILTFNDKEHFDSWVNYLSEIIIKDTSTTDTTSQDSILHAVEIELGFNSLRQKEYEELEALSQIGWLTLEEIPQGHWLHNIITMSIFNEYEEVKINDKIYSLINSEKSFVIKDPEILNTVRAFKASQYTCVEDIYVLDGITQDGIILKENIDDIGVSQDGNLTTSNDLFEEGEDVVILMEGTEDENDLTAIAGSQSRDNCEGKKIILNGFYVYNPSNFSKVNANYSIDWGDGNGSQGLGSYTTLTIDHLYSSNGQKQVNLYATYAGKNFQWVINVEPKTYCSGKNATHVEWYYPAPYQWAIRGSITDGGLKYTSASSESYKWNTSKSRWEKAKCENLYASIEIRKVTTGCNFDADVFKSNSSYSCQKISAITSESNFQYDYIKCKYGIYGTGNWNVYEHIVNNCQ